MKDSERVARIQAADMALMMRVEIYLETKSLAERISMLPDIERDLEALMSLVIAPEN
jgi:hypothetical protein